tara:strand:+ start:4034 stop:4372 length:339 start_codon:yes stop_codon:yes gene_type:complete
MAVPVVNIQIEQGTDFEAAFTIKKADGTRYNLTNTTLSAKMRKWSGSSGYIGFGVTFGAVPANGVITISLTDAQSGIITSGRYNYDILVQDNVSTKINKVIQGQAQVNDTVS